MQHRIQSNISFFAEIIVWYGNTCFLLELSVVTLLSREFINSSAISTPKSKTAFTLTNMLYRLVHDADCCYFFLLHIYHSSFAFVSYLISFLLFSQYVSSLNVIPQHSFYVFTRKLMNKHAYTGHCFLKLVKGYRTDAGFVQVCFFKLQYTNAMKSFSIHTVFD